jgi:hypothetical protein
VIGLYFLADGFAEFCRFTFSEGLNYALDGPVTLKSSWTGMTRFQVLALLQLMVKLTIGAALVLGRGATVATLRQARYWVKKSGAHGPTSQRKIEHTRQVKPMMMSPRGPTEKSSRPKSMSAI